MADNQRPLLGFETESIITQHAISAFLVNTLNAQIQVKYKSTTSSPFDTHNWVMFAFLVVLFIYATTSVAEIMLRARESTYHSIVGYIRLFASGFSTILLLVILDPILGYIISVLWGCLFATVTYESYKESVLNLGTKLVGILTYYKQEEPKQVIHSDVGATQPDV